MRLYVTVPLALLMATACDSTDGVSAEDALVQTAIAGEEEAYSRENYAMTEDAETQPLLRECDAQAEYDRLFEAMDADADGELGPPEQDDVHAHHPPPFAPGPWQMIAFVYDSGRDGALSDAERTVILDDFTARCEALHAKLLAEFDADGDGTLSDDELATAKAALDERRPPPPPEDGERPEGPPPEGMDTAGRPEGPPPEGPPAEGEIPPPFLAFDTDGDGALSDAEFEALQADVRAHVRNGDPPPPPPGAPRPPEE